jgi:Fe2+ or Zn2+ uptake regulation protein
MIQTYSKADAGKALTEAGIKPSAQRVAIMQYLMASHAHPTVDEIFRALSDEYPTLSRTTVYNTVWLLAESGAVKSISIDRANARFDYTPEPHAHFRCRSCGKIVDVMLGELPKPSAPGLIIDSVNVFYEGLCDECVTKQSKQN